jgi:MerC mercury resistance protein
MDTVAWGLSIACLLHCLLLPVAASLIPLLGAAARAEWVHWALLALAVPVTVLALRGTGTPRASRLLAGLGIATLGMGAAELPLPAFEAPMSITGALVLSAAHGLNALSRTRIRRTVETE